MKNEDIEIIEDFSDVNFSNTNISQKEHIQNSVEENNYSSLFKEEKMKPYAPEEFKNNSNNLTSQNQNLNFDIKEEIFEQPLEQTVIQKKDDQTKAEFSNINDSLETLNDLNNNLNFQPDLNNNLTESTEKNDSFQPEVDTSVSEFEKMVNEAKINNEILAEEVKQENNQMFYVPNDVENNVNNNYYFVNDSNNNLVQTNDSNNDLIHTNYSNNNFSNINNDLTITAVLPNGFVVDQQEEMENTQVIKPKKGLGTDLYLIIIVGVLGITLIVLLTVFYL